MTERGSFGEPFYVGTESTELRGYVQEPDGQKTPHAVRFINSEVSRWNLGEIEDQPWCPASIRSFAMDHLRTIFALLRPYDRCVSLLKKVLQASGTTQVVDLCSGRGGPWPSLLSALESDGVLCTVTLTDLYPPSGPSPHERITLREDPIDAATFPKGLPGTITMFTALHHFEPFTVRRILHRATRDSRCIALFETTERSALALFHVCAATLLVFLTTPFIRPFSLQRIFLTYIIPCVPLLALVDGVLSALRSYSVEDLRTLSAGIGGKTYEWEAGRLPPSFFRPAVTYLIGKPRPD